MKGKFVTVTGAASGIGRATAIRLAELGAAGIAICDIEEVGLAETEKKCKELGARVTSRRVDVSNSEQVTQWVEDAFADFGRLDACANVAGLAGGDGETTAQTIVQKDWDRMMNVNLSGVMYCMRAQLARIVKPGGSILNVASAAGVKGLPRSAAYSASKFGVVGLTESAAGEFGEIGVRINSILPGPIDTKIFRDGEAKGLFDAKRMSANTLLKRMGQPEEIAKVICFVLSDDASYVTGAHWLVDGGYNAC